MIIAAAAADATSAAAAMPVMLLPQPPPVESDPTFESVGPPVESDVSEVLSPGSGVSEPLSVTFSSTSKTSLSNALAACTRTAILPSSDGV